MKRITLCLALLAALLLAGCVKTDYTAVDAQKLTATVERKGAVTETAASGDAFSLDHPEALVARVLFADSEAGWSGAFWEFDSEAAAKACFARLTEAYQPPQTFSPGEGYDRFETTLDGGAQPVVRVVRVHATVLLASCADTQAGRSAVTALLKTLRYN